MCISCEVMGPNLSSDAELIAAWNTRAPTDALAAARGEWMPIESAPKDGTRFLIYTKQGLPLVVHYSEYGRLEDDHDTIWILDKGANTKWSPLPEPPQ